MKKILKKFNDIFFNEKNLMIYFESYFCPQKNNNSEMKNSFEFKQKKSAESIQNIILSRFRNFCHLVWNKFFILEFF